MPQMAQVSEIQLAESLKHLESALLFENAKVSKEMKKDLEYCDFDAYRINLNFITQFSNCLGDLRNVDGNNTPLFLYRSVFHSYSFDVVRSHYSY